MGVCMSLVLDTSIFKELFASLPGHAYCKGLDGRYLACNVEFANFINLPNPDAIVGKSDVELFKSAVADKVVATDKKVIQSGEEFSVEEFALDKHGNEVVYLSKKKPLRNENGEIIGLIGTSVDITSHKEKLSTFDKLRLKNAQMNRILWQLPEQFYWVDKSGTVLACNERQANLFGLSQDEFVGMNLYDLGERMGWSRAAVDELRANDLKVMETGELVVVEETLELEGVPRTYLGYKYPLYQEDGEIIGTFGLSIDITDRKEIERKFFEEKSKAEIANHAKSQFLMNMSHDIRSPFSGIIGLVELLYRHEESDAKKEILMQVIDSGKKLFGLLNDMIDVVQLENSEYMGDIVEFNLAESIEKIVSIFQITAMQKNLNIEVNIADDVPVSVVSDSKSLERILLNLLGNAIKFTHHGKITIDVKSPSKTNTTANLEIVVTDTGIGIDKLQQNYIFDRFTRVAPAYENQYQGSGLGLWITKKLVENIGGDISVDSEIEKGTKFTIHFTCQLPARQDAEFTAETFCEPLPQVSINRILVVEDDPIACKIATSLFSEYFNAEVDLAKSGQEALLLTKSNHYDFILMDMGLPDVDGLVLANKIKQQSSFRVETPIIGITAHLTASGVHNLLDSENMAIIFEKPLSLHHCQQISQLLSMI